MNVFGDMESHEIAAIFGGYVHKHEIQNNHNTQDVYRYSSSIKSAASVDWRTKGAVTAVRDEGYCGSPWAFSATGAVEGQHFIKNGQLVSLSEQNLIDCSRDYGNYGCSGGFMKSSFRYIEENGGIDTEESYPYQGHDGKCRFKPEHIGAKINGYVAIEQGSEQALTQAIQTIGPISVAMDASRPTFHYYKNGVYFDANCSSTSLDHAGLAVGYGSEDGKDYYIVKNSWGTMWGMDGYMLMSRNRGNNCGIATQASYPKVNGNSSYATQYKILPK